MKNIGHMRTKCYKTQHYSYHMLGELEFISLEEYRRQ